MAKEKKEPKSELKGKPESESKKEKNEANEALQHIHKDMAMGEIVMRYPETIPVILSHGLHCIGCHVSPYESIEQGSLGHGMSEEEFEMLLKEVNEAAAETERKRKQHREEMEQVQQQEAQHQA
jgi:hybrid cluster-associated redox disulfide protein